MNDWVLSASDVLADTPWLTIEKNDYLIDGAELNEYYVLRRPAFVVVIASDEAGRIVLVRQYRPATAEFYLAFPAGYIALGEDPQQAAIRELLEESGAVGHDWREVGKLDPLPGYIESRAHIFSCNVVSIDEAAQVPEAGEDVTVMMLERSEVLEAIVGGRITEMQAVAAFLLDQAVVGS